MKTLYSTLGVPPAVTPTALRDRYIALAKTVHPDAGGDGEQMRALADAYAVLKDAARRARYDAELRLLNAARLCKFCNGRGLVTRQTSFLGREDRPCIACAGEGYL